MNKTIRLNDYDFSYVEKGIGETVVLVHGSASDFRTWNAQIEAFAEEFHLISYSRRFHWPNLSIRENQDYAMQQHLTDLKAIIKYFGKGPVHLVGHSYGALLGIELACSNPELIRKLVLAEPPAIRLFVSNVPKPAQLVKLLFTRLRTALSVIKLAVTGFGPATKAARQGNMVKAMQLFGKAVLGKKAFRQMTDEKEKEIVLMNFPAAELTGSGFLPIPIEILSKTTIPTLLLTGEHSPGIFSHLADRLEEILPVTKRQIIPGASHIMHEDNPENFNSVVLAYLKSEMAG